jgi:hypothetical protein
LLGAGAALSQGSAQLKSQVEAMLQQHSIEVENVDSLSDTQLHQVALYLSTSEGQAEHAAAIERLLAVDQDCVGNQQMRDGVANQLRQHDISITNIDTLSGSEIAVLQAVVNSNQPTSTMAAQVKRVLGAESPIIGNAQLRTEVGSCVRQLNADVDLEALTPAQLVQIQLIAGGSDSADDKRRMIEKLAEE